MKQINKQWDQQKQRYRDSSMLTCVLMMSVLRVSVRGGKSSRLTVKTPAGTLHSLPGDTHTHTILGILQKYIFRFFFFQSSEFFFLHVPSWAQCSWEDQLQIDSLGTIYTVVQHDMKFTFHRPFLFSKMSFTSNLFFWLNNYKNPCGLGTYLWGTQ